MIMKNLNHSVAENGMIEEEKVIGRRENSEGEGRRGSGGDSVRFEIEVKSEVWVGGFNGATSVDDNGNGKGKRKVSLSLGAAEFAGGGIVSHRRLFLCFKCA